jgi:hypothetical protein
VKVNDSSTYNFLLLEDIRHNDDTHAQKGLPAGVECISAMMPAVWSHTTPPLLALTQTSICASAFIFPFNCFRPQMFKVKAIDVPNTFMVL